MSERVSRRDFLRGAVVLPAAVGLERLGLGAPAGNDGGAGTILFVGVQTPGTPNRGIQAFRWDAATGTLEPLGLAAEIANPTFIALSPDRRLLFAACELDAFEGDKTGAVASFRVRDGGQAAGKLSRLSAQKAEGQGTCHVGVDHTGRTLLCANYTGGSAASFRIGADGDLSPAVSSFRYDGRGPNPKRQDASHVHRATASPGNGFALFNDLGLDVIHVYALNAKTAELTAHTPSMWQAPAGSGPRALRFHPSGRWAYCVLELASAIAVLDWDEARGTFGMKQQVRLPPDDFEGTARASEIVLDRAGKFAYAACRDYDCLVTFHVEPGSGKLIFGGRSSCGGKVPRHIALDPTERWLLVANEASDTIATIARDPVTGVLSNVPRTVPQAKPQCLVFL